MKSHNESQPIKLNYPQRPEGLTEAKNKHLDVVELIFQGYSKRAAYQKIYPDSSKGTASSKAFELMKFPHAQYFYARLQEWASANAEIESWRIIQELKWIAFGRPDMVMGWDESGIRLKKSRDLEPEDIAQISSISSTTRASENGDTITTTRATFHPKVQALKTLAEMGGFTSDLNTAIRTLQSYGILLKQDNEGKYFIENMQGTGGDLN